MSSFIYWLPDENGNKIDCETSNNSIVIIGANGSGKSKLGAWIEKQDFSSVHRIGAQRNLNFNENLVLKSYEQAEDLVFYGSVDAGSTRDQKSVRWNWGNSYTTKLMDDFENVLAALIALKNNDNDQFVNDCKLAESVGEQPPKAPITSIDKLYSIWNDVFPQRKLYVKDAKFLAAIKNNGEELEYSASQMSDGERSVLYLAAQVLCVPQNKILIIDEPEIHLHRSLINRLWTALEKFRQDCIFIYITHDTQFASLHSNADKIWIKEFDGKNWKLEKLTNNNLPESLLLDILGNRKNVLFVEGENDSHDVRLYSELYPTYYVIPCGSCSQVIARTKVFKQNLALHDCIVYGIIDRDFRSEYEIEKYKNDNIFTIDVAEVENLFLVESLIRVIATHLAKNDNDVYENIRKYIIQERFANQINGQICQSVIAQIKYELNSSEISKKNEAKAKQSLCSLFNSIKYDEISAIHENKFERVLTSGNYNDVLKVFNEKNMVSSIGHYFSICNNAYCELVIGLMNNDTEQRQSILDALLPYLPPEIPR